MGTRMQPDSYLLEYSSMKNPNEDSVSSWFSYYDKRSMNEHLYNSSWLRPVNGYSGYNKEMLKQTVLEHEAIFRKQVCELHRLYRTQKDLMESLKKQDLYTRSNQSGISHSCLFSPLTSQTTEMLWTIPTDDIKPSLDFLKQSYSHFSHIPRENGVFSMKSKLLDTNLKSGSKQMLDLQFPAEEYIDAEDSDIIEKEQMFKPFCDVKNNPSIIYDTEHEIDVKLTLGTRENSLRQNCQPIQRLEYINGFKNGSISNHFKYDDQSATRTNPNLMPTDLFNDLCRDEGSCSNLFDAIKGKAERDWQLLNYVNGINENHYNSLTLGLSNQMYQKQFEPLKWRHVSDHNMPSYEFEKKSNLYIGTCQNNSSPVDRTYSIPSNSQVLVPLSVSPYWEDVSAITPVASSKSKIPKTITLVPIAVQALPCFLTSENVNSWSKNPKSIKNPINCSPKKINIDLNTLEISSEDNVLYSHDTHGTLAAENLVTLSQGIPPPSDLLHWFADTILSENLSNINDSVEIDLFESLTLNLEEMMPDEYLPPKQEHIYMEEHKSQARKGRQKKKDFQKDILPGLVSLSRHELKEDMHAFDCVMKAMGEKWESKLMKKNLAKGRARQQPSSKSLVVDSKVDVCKLKIVGWGRKTRRGQKTRARKFSNATPVLSCKEGN